MGLKGGLKVLFLVQPALKKSIKGADDSSSFEMCFMKNPFMGFFLEF